MLEKRNKLEEVIKVREFKNIEENANYCREKIIPSMNELRKTADELEEKVNEEFWPFPSYSDLLYTVI